MTNDPNKNSESKGGRERRQYPRYDVSSLSVDYSSGENFLFSYIQNISEMGIFIRSDDPLVLGTQLNLRFGLDGQEPLQVEGKVVWVNPVKETGDNINPGMGVQFLGLSAEDREQVVSMIKTVAYLAE